MELQQKRLVEYWLDFMGQSHLVASEKISFQDGNDLVFFEVLGSRVLLSRMTLLDRLRVADPVLAIIELLAPEMCLGIPMRVWSLGDSSLLISASPAQRSTADNFLEISRLQKRLFDRIKVS